jgi:ADP-ribosyl-[dinitrogen reductase] hydrolase
VNLGDDADTTGAIYGQLARGFYGEQAIPLAWRAKLAHSAPLTSFADKLLIPSKVAALWSLD